MSKSIQLVPDEQTSKKLDVIAKQMRTTRAGFARFALEFVLPRIESGEMEFVNGRFQPARTPATHAA